MAQKVILRHPGGILVFETDNFNLMQDFINWIIQCNHFYEYDKENNIFFFTQSKFTSMCNIKWKKLCYS
jgi:hypothetical protein